MQVAGGRQVWNFSAMKADTALSTRRPDDDRLLIQSRWQAAVGGSALVNSAAVPLRPPSSPLTVLVLERRVPKHLLTYLLIYLLTYLLTD